MSDKCKKFYIYTVYQQLTLTLARQTEEVHLIFIRYSPHGQYTPNSPQEKHCTKQSDL